MSKINSTHTSCEKCSFAKYENATQTDCLLGLIDKYKKTDHIHVIEAYNEEKEFFVINNKQCAAYKLPSFFEQNQIEDKISYAKENFKIKYNAIIDTRDNSLEYLYELLEEIKKSNVMPDTITLVIKPGDSPSDYFVQLNRSKIPSKWKIKNLQYDNHGFLAIVHEIIGVGNSNCPFIFAIKNKNSIVKIINEANKIVYEEFKRFMVISDETKSNLMFNKFVYQLGLQKQHDIITHYEEYTYI